MPPYHEIVWLNYKRFSEARGRLICSILEKYIKLENSLVLDLGCGVGGASLALIKSGAKVTAIDADSAKLQYLYDISRQYPEELKVRQMFAENLLEVDMYHAIILWDVFEHLSHPSEVLECSYRALKADGILLLATPNRLSLVNWLCDPHYGLPLLALCRRLTITKIIGEYLHWHSAEKPDYPELSSLHQLDAMMQSAGFHWQLINRACLALVFANPEGLWNRPFHLWFFSIIKKIKLDQLIAKMTTNKNNFINKFLQPTFFILAKKSNPKN